MRFRGARSLRLSSALLGLLAFFGPSRANATFSIVAFDSTTGERGAAIASCVGDSFDLAEAVVTDENFGVFVAQGYFESGERDALTRLLREGRSADEALAVVGAPTRVGSDGLDSSYRQYGIALVDGTTSGFSGSSLDDYAGDAQREREGVVVSVQGNLLDGPEVLDDLEAGFFGAREARLEGRLASALLRVFDERSGDVRCPESGADQFYLRVETNDRGEFEASKTSPDAEPMRESLRKIREEALVPSGGGCSWGGRGFSGSGMVFVSILVLLGLGRQHRR